MKKNKKKGFTLLELVIAIALFAIIILAGYRLFFSEVRAIRSALEHVGINESARRVFFYLSNDIRNSNWVDYPQPIMRQTVANLLPQSEGKILTLRTQNFDFSVKPPDTEFLKEQTVDYLLKKNENGTSDLFRLIQSDYSDPNKKTQMKVADGIKEITVFLTQRRPAMLSKISAGASSENLISYHPYDLDGHGPYLVHVHISFTRAKSVSDSTVHTIKTCFAVRGKLNGVHP